MSLRDRLTKLFGTGKKEEEPLPLPPSPSEPSELLEEEEQESPVDADRKEIIGEVNAGNHKSRTPEKINKVKVRKVKAKGGMEIKLKGDLRDPSHPIEVTEKGSGKYDDIIDRDTKFNDDQRLRVCEMIAQFKSESDIIRRCQSEWNITVSRQNIWQYMHSKKWKSIIDKFRHEYVMQTMEIPIMHKKVRLERLEDLYQKNMLDPAIDGFSRRNQCMAILASAMREVDEKASNFTTVYANQIINLSDDELMKRKQKIIDRVQTIDITPKKQLDHGIDTEALPVQ